MKHRTAFSRGARAPFHDRPVLLCLALLLAGVASASAQDGSGLPGPSGFTASARIGFASPGPDLSWRAEGSASLGGTLYVPAMTGKGILFDGNHLAFGFDASLSSSWAAVRARVRAQFIQLLSIEATSSIGTGWSVSLPDATIIGLGLNPADDSRGIEAQSIGTYVWDSKVEAVAYLCVEQLTLDPWTRIYVEARPGLRYLVNSAAASGQAWQWQDADATRFNGFMLEQDYRIGYKPPVMLGPQDISIGIGLRSWLFDVANQSTIASGGWGSDFAWVRGSVRLEWRLSAWSTIVATPFLDVVPDWSQASKAAHRYFGFRTYEDPATILGVSVGYARAL